MQRRWVALLFAGAACCALAPAPAALAQKTVTIIREIDADRYDPHRSAARSTAEVLFMAGDTLVGIDYDMKTIVPSLAKSWTVSSDGLTYTFKLRDGVTFCDGKKLTAKDVVGTYERWHDPETKGILKWRMGEVDKISAPDDTTVEYRLKQPYSELLFQMTQYFHTIIDPAQAKALGPDLGVKAFNGTGPYCFQSWTPRDEVVLTKHQGYDWGPPIYKNPAPQIDRIVWKVVPEENTRVAVMQTGQADASQTIYMPFWSLKDFEADKRMSVAKADNYYWTYFIGFKIDREFMNDARVRKAINLAVDKKAITDAVTFGYAEPATSYLSPDVLDFDKTLGKEDLGTNPERAMKLLDEAGWKLGPDKFRYKDGKKLTPVLYGITGFFRDIAEAVQGDLRKVGIDLQVQLFDATIAWGKLATQEFDAFGMSFPYVSAGEALNLYFRSANVPTPNRMNWKDAETDQWLLAGSGAIDPAVRTANFQKVQKKVQDAAVWLPLYHEPLYAVVGPRLKPVRPHGLYGTAFYKGLDLELK